ncbi:hypothetical protein [Achromobacter sp. UMC46]|uniref:hypothetical protein n=1 Tax=Achromobacter sp. UMC46 TaxID=1862319 RepID=UPI001603C47A|nr:hypothetical protein [Achromobacter sp. UMC46]MBB1595581.1 hypothetical protein [Achromobacter sp. UMC46]
MLKPAPETVTEKPAASEEKPQATDPRKGTGIMPMPDQSNMVAGMPRRGRAIEEPGDPGIITPEDDVLDTSYENHKR